MNVPETAMTAAARKAAEVLRQDGHEALWAGGCVRDLIMGRTPNDIDIATSAVPDRVLDLFPGSVAVGRSFGVVRVPVDGEWFEVATFREDRGYVDGRHPSAIVFSDAPTDASRRDFTINALFYDPAADRIHDYVDGHLDIDRRCIRCVGRPEHRFAEDHLRMLRAIRFAATLDFAVDPATARAIRSEARCIVRISPERIREEMSRTLCEAVRAGDALHSLDDHELLRWILPEVCAMKGQQQPPRFHPEGDVFEHTVLMLNLMARRQEELAFAVLLHDVGKPPTAVWDGKRWRFNEHAGVGGRMAEEIMERLRFPSHRVRRVAQTIRGHMRFQDVDNMKRSTLRRFIGRDTFDLELEVHRLDCLASHGDLSHYKFLLRVREEFESEPALPSPWVTGKDLLALGLEPGPQIGRWKQEAYDRQLEGEIRDRRTLLSWIASRIGNRPTRNDS